MSVQITTAFTKQYQSSCELVVQQIESRAREKVMVQSIAGSQKAFMDFIGKASVTQRLTRHGDTQYSDTPHSRRMITTTPWQVADLIDKPDQARILIDPQSKYLQAFRAAMNRKIDETLFAAMRGTSYSGEDGATPVVLPPGQKIAHANQGLTVGKLITASEKLNSADVPSEEEGGSNFTRWMAIGPKQISNLLAEVEVGSADFNLVKPLTEGKVSRFMGFNFVPTNQLYTASSIRYCLCWVKAGVGMALSYDIIATVDRLPMKQNSIQAYLEMMFGATRLQEELVIEVACSEA